MTATYTADLLAIVSRAEQHVFSRLIVGVALCSPACSRAHVARESADGGQDATQALDPLQQANEIADNLELAYQRYFTCMGLSTEDDVWDGYGRECFVAFIAPHLERQDGLASCVRETILAFSQCGEATPCNSLPCVSATLLDDNPVSELVTEDCSAALDAATRGELRACKEQ